MTSFQSVWLVLGALAVVVVSIATTVAMLRRARTRARARRRVVEKPNSHYTAPGVIENETRHRWHDIALERVHEINRGEVVRLIARADAGGVDALRPNERAFLDQISRIAAEPPRESGGTGPMPRLTEQPA
jgi:hypothetical protein